MGTMVSQITSLTIVYSTVHSCADQGKYQSSASLAFVRGIHWWPVNSAHKWPVTRQMFPFNDVIMNLVGRLSMSLMNNLIWSQIYSMGLESGLRAGHSMISTPSLPRKLRVFHAVWALALLCTNTKFLWKAVLAQGRRFGHRILM